MSEISKQVEGERNISWINDVDESVRCEKRQRETSLRDSSGASIDEDGFNLVTRRRPKRLALNHSSSSDFNDDIEMVKENQENEKIEVSVTSKEILPKQMALAKLLRTENIQNILNIKYRGPYKVLIQFGDTENAHKLLSNKKFAESDYRCQLTQGLQMTFGTVRNIDLDVQEEAMVELFESEFEILSVKRLKRVSDNGDWIESEAVRVCFKSSTLPSYILIYGCRFKVDPFTFPVTQCSSCWRYGHSKNFCPVKKVFCPKCGNHHPNCETKSYKCINCNGDHMAVDRKSCPVFHKEKEIRKIMCEENCKYRKALLIYYNKKKVSERLQRNMTEVHDETRNSNGNHNEVISNKTYRDVLVADVEIHCENNEISSNSELEEDEIVSVPGSHKVKRRKKKVNKVENKVCDIESIVEDKDTGRLQGEDNQNERKRKSFNFTRLLLKMKEVCFSQTSFESKMKLILRLIIEEIKVIVVDLIRDSETMKNLFNIFCNG